MALELKRRSPSKEELRVDAGGGGARCGACSAASVRSVRTDTEDAKVVWVGTYGYVLHSKRWIADCHDGGAGFTKRNGSSRKFMGGHEKGSKKGLMGRIRVAAAVDESGWMWALAMGYGPSSTIRKRKSSVSPVSPALAPMVTSRLGTDRYCDD